MELIITADELKEHRVEKYYFRRVDRLGLETSEPDAEEKLQKFTIKNFDAESQDLVEAAPESQIEALDDDADSQDLGDETQAQTNEDLLKKIDELSSSVVKLEMQLEKKEEEHKYELEKIRQEAYDDGLNKGEESALAKVKDTMDEYQDKLYSSIKKLDVASIEYASGINKLEEELVSVALEIAAEVVAKEVQSNSKEVALALAKSLLGSVKDASKVTVKVSAKDAGLLREHFKDRVQIEEDDALSPGGVVIISDVGNINADIQKRFEKIKAHGLEGN
ncbi:MAG: flagellar assembly protein FliH [Helicobacteraceae bacterium]